MAKRAKVVVTVVAALLLGAPAALAASPRDIYRDLADNGQLDRTYTKAEMRAFLDDAPVQGYGNAVVSPTTPGGVAGEVSEPPPASAGLDDTVTVDALPFTGAELGVLALVGASLLLGGFLLRASARTA